MVGIAAGTFIQAMTTNLLSFTGTKKSKSGFADPAKVQEAFGF
jgi:hypothetical protein